MLLRSAGYGILPSLIAVLLAVATTARAQAPLFNEVHTLAASTTGVPVEHTFSVTTAGNYSIVLTDLGASQPPPLPAAPLASVKLAVTSSNALVGTPLIGAGTLTLNSLAVGTYTLHVVGMPGSVPGSGPISTVVNGPGNTQVESWQDEIALPSNGLPNGEAVLDPAQPFTVPATGTYTVTLADLMLPQALNAVSLVVLQEGAGPPPLVQLPNNTLPNPLQWTGTLNASVNYQVFAIGQANAATNAGLYSVVITTAPPPPAPPAFIKGWTVPVGNTMLIGSPALKASGTNADALVLTDLKFPSALQQVQAMLMHNGQAVASLTAAGSASFTAVTDTYEAYAVGVAATAAPAAGSYAVQVTNGGTTLYSWANGVTAAGSGLFPYSFNTTLASGMYTVSLTDFQFPAALTSIQLGAVQAGALLGTAITGPGNFNICSSCKGASGPVTLLTFAQPAQAGGLFGIDIAPQTGGAAVFDVTQGTGALFISRQINVLAPGNYSVTATDLSFPAPFQNYDTVVTQGTTQLGSIFGGGTFVINAAAAGNYSVNFLAQPGGTDAAGTYALTVAQAPPSPVVSFSVDNSQVSSGSTANLIWSSQNATYCTASSGWSGKKSTSGTYTTPALSTNTTFTLTCTGAGGISPAKSVKVTIAASGGGGGGGALDVPLLMLLLAVLAARCPAVMRSSCRLPTVLPARSTTITSELNT